MKTLLDTFQKSDQEPRRHELAHRLANAISYIEDVAVDVATVYYKGHERRRIDVRHNTGGKIIGVVTVREDEVVCYFYTPRFPRFEENVTKVCDGENLQFHWNVPDPSNPKKDYANLTLSVAIVGSVATWFAVSAWAVFKVLAG